MNIVLTGFMGTGKSAVGRQVADKLKVQFVDIDEVITKRARKTVSEIFEESGEEAFRKLESEAIAEVATKNKMVIATGGGSLMDPANREALEKNGILVCLRARTGTLLERLKDDMTRPLLAGEDQEARIKRLLAERDAFYDLCPTQVSTDNKTIPQVADEIVKKVASQWR